MKVVYTPLDANNTKVAELFGMTFYAGREEDVSELPEDQRRKLAGNPQFVVTEPDAAASEQKRKPGRPRKEPDGDLIGDAD